MIALVYNVCTMLAKGNNIFVCEVTQKIIKYYGRDGRWYKVIQVFLTEKEMKILKKNMSLTRTWNSKLWTIKKNNNQDYYTLYQTRYINGRCKMWRVCEIDEPIVYDKN